MVARREAGCSVDDGQLAEFLDGETDDATTISLAQHVAGCGHCQARAAAQRVSAGALRAVGADQVIRWHRFKSAFGTMYAARTDQGLSRISWQQPSPSAFESQLQRRYPKLPLVRDRDALKGVEEEVTRYFDRELDQFTFPVDLTGLGEFQRTVLEEAARIPFGDVIPYAELARRIQRPKAARAVGNALGANPVAIVVPCHRIIASDGSLGGYTGGVDFKRRLLDVEGRRDLFSGVR